eukprot:CAMPEP_0180522240 /NCGR_PEP_ID=MMETSP1036_2-20121128/57299_1 /TAXON_ID=632150 /ORGANISM="Azadinium spinosum, Strain 3D9" /LENGTH=35 /DNA_ID= /DNA_START= /DNA_END= /DNA_ORIENTATION=
MTQTPGAMPLALTAHPPGGKQLTGDRTGGTILSHV